MELMVPYGAHAPQNRNTGLKVGIAVLIVVIAAVCITVGMMFSNPYKGRGLETVQPSDSLGRTAAASILTGKETTFSADEVNAYLAYLVQKDGEKGRTGNLQIQAVAIADASGNSADLYLPVVYRGKSLAVTLNVTPALDVQEQQLRFQVNSAKIGQLPVPADWLLGQAESHLPQSFRHDGTVISCKLPSIKASALGVTASAGLTKLKLNDGNLTLAAKAQITLG